MSAIPKRARGVNESAGDWESPEAHELLARVRELCGVRVGEPLPVAGPFARDDVSWPAIEAHHAEAERDCARWHLDSDLPRHVAEAAVAYRAERDRRQPLPSTPSADGGTRAAAEPADGDGAPPLGDTPPDEGRRQDSCGAHSSEEASTVPPAGRALIVRRASEIEPESITWVWRGRLAIGKQTCVAGDPGTGKSKLAIYAAAAVTTGGKWPCGEGSAPRGSVIILCAEDGAADTIVPRLMAAGADRDRVYIVPAVSLNDGRGRRSFNLQTDLDLLEKKIAELRDVKLVIIDPVSSYLGKKIDSYNNSDIRGVLEPFGEMAERKRVAVLSITHFSKGSASASTKALHRFIGSIAFVASARMAYVVTQDQQDSALRLFLHAKNNLAAPAQGLAFRLEQRLVGKGNDIVASSIFWESEPVSTTADQALRATGDDEPTATDEWIDFLEAMLAGRSARVPRIQEEARSAGLLDAEQGISQSKPCRRARRALGVISEKLGMDKGWVWRLPKVPSEPEGALSKGRAPSVPEGAFGAERSTESDDF